MKKYLAVALATFAVATAQAALVGRDINGNAVAGNAASSVFLYDDVLNVTWLRDANYAKTSAYAGADSYGGMNWGAAKTWAANLVVGAYDDWRLPTMISTPNATLSFSGGTDYGYNVRTKSGNATQFQSGQTVFSEMAHLWYSTLGNKAYCNPVGSTASSCNRPQAGWGLTNSSNFQNLQAGTYWIGLESGEVSLPATDFAWIFNTGSGNQGIVYNADPYLALAVRSGDVLAPSAVPIPAAAWLMVSGIGALGAAARRRKAS